MIAASTSDYRELARKRLPHFLFEYIDGGSYDEVTLQRNLDDLQSIALRQRVLRDVSNLDLSTTLFGRSFAIPLGLGPIGLAGMTSRRGEVKACRAARTAQIPFCLSTVSACSLREVRDASPEPFWFQLYMIRDRAFMRELLAVARDCACNALVFTVDMPAPGARYRDVRSGLSGAPGLRGKIRRIAQALLRPGWAYDVGLMGGPHTLGNVAPMLERGSGLEDFLGWMRANFDPRVTWTDIAWLRQHWDGPLIIKGILDPADAKEALALGADGVVVSNHGGRQLDGVMSSAAALPAIVDAIEGRMTILVDGGVRSGLDVVRMLALGADAVLLGRAWIYALGAGGETALANLITLFEAEIRIAMMLTGTTHASAIDRTILVAPRCAA